MANYRLSVIQDGRRKSVETNLEEFSFLRLLVQSKSIREESGQLFLEGPVTLGAPGVLSTDAVQLGQLAPIQQLLVDVQNGLEDLQDLLVANDLIASENSAAIDAINCKLDHITTNNPIEEPLVAGSGGQTVFQFSNLSFLVDNSIPDVEIWIGTEKQIQDLAGGTDYSFVKISSNEIEFSEIVPEGELVLGRMSNPNLVGPKIVIPFFREYVEANPPALPNKQKLVTLSQDFTLGTGQLSFFRNMVQGTQSPLVGPIAQRYAENNRRNISLAIGAEASVDEIFTFYHLDEQAGGPPEYKITFEGQTGTIFTIPNYPIGNHRLRVYRNGLMMNTAGIGVVALQYTETSNTSITLAESLLEDENLVIELASKDPLWRDDLDGITGVNVNFTIPKVYTIGDRRLQVFKNGLLMYESTTLSEPEHRYTENGINCVLLETPINPDDVITAIYLA